MRPYLAIIKDSFREALASRVLWVLLALITVTLLGIAPLTYREEATVGLREREVEAWPLMVEKLREASRSLVMSPAKRVWSLLDEEGKKAVREFKKLPPQPNLRDVREMQRSGRILFKSLDRAVRRDDFYDAEAWKDAPVSRELKDLQKTPYDKLNSQDRLRENRLLMEAAFPDLISSSSSTSLVFRYAVWNLGQPFPIRKQQFVEALFKQLPWLIDKGILSLGLLIAVLVTAPIIPQMLDPGSLHLLLSKPITRPLLYLSRFLGGCAFVLLAAFYLFVGMWLIFGVQWGVWEPQILWCIPVYTFVFATYYSVAALAGSIWRNATVAVILTFLFWAVCFSVGSGESVLGGMILRYRIGRIAPAASDVLAADEVNTLLAWDEEKRDWKPLFTSNEHETIRSSLILLRVPLPPPMVGPVYDAKDEQVVAASPSFKMFGRMVMLSARKAAEWKATEGSPPRGQPIAMLQEPDGHPLLVTNTGLSRVVHDVAAGAVMLKMPGFSIPLSRAEALEDAGPSPAPYWGEPSAAAIDGQTGRVFVYSRGELTILEKGTAAKYSVAIEKKILDSEKESAVIAAGGGHCFLALKDGRILNLEGDDLTAGTEYKLPGESPPRTGAMTPDGKRLLLLAHGGVLHQLDMATGRFGRPAIRGQGDISALAVTSDGTLYTASRATRVTEYEIATMKELRTFAPPLNLQERVYYYGIQPAHALLPKPGEFYKTVQYLLVRQQTSGGDENNLATAQAKLDPWSPIYSGLAFQAVMLFLGCLYIQRQEF
jgi:ABC-type transport system involved in multi-copper enzyme maturation permease subunit